MRRRILLYSDSAEFGGHEVMSVKMVNALAGSYDVVFFFHHEKIGRELSASVKQERIPFRTQQGRLAFLRNLNLADIIDVRRRIKLAAPDLVIILQPAIDFCLRGAIAARWLGVRTVSYIPNCFSARMQGAPLGILADKLLAVYYRLFNGFITINSIQKALIEDKTGGKTPVQVIENVVDIPEDGELMPVGEASSTVLRIGVIGRIQFAQKGYDRVLRIAEKLRLKRSSFQMVIIGDGPDRCYLEQAVKEKGLGDNFVFKGWMDNRKEIYSSVDLLLLASGFEGTPLTLIECLLNQKMAFGFLGDGTQILKEYLDPKWLYSSDDEAVEKLANAEMYIKEFNARKHEIREKVANRHSPEVFERTLLGIVESFAKRNIA